MEKQEADFIDLGIVEYKNAWDLQENLLQKNVEIKIAAKREDINYDAKKIATKNYLLFCEHFPVYTLGKSGLPKHMLYSETQMKEKGISFFQTNRGGDITFHGPEQLVAYPIFDLEKFYTDIGKYLRNLEEAVILTIAEYGLVGERSIGETGVWLDTNIKGRERKICAIGVRCSRWITMHGLALNVNTDLNYFAGIVPCGIQGKQVTSLQKELGFLVNISEVKEKLKKNFAELYSLEYTNSNALV